MKKNLLNLLILGAAATTIAACSCGTNSAPSAVTATAVAIPAGYSTVVSGSAVVINVDSGMVATLVNGVYVFIDVGPTVASKLEGATSVAISGNNILFTIPGDAPSLNTVVSVPVVSTATKLQDSITVQYYNNIPNSGISNTMVVEDTIGHDLVAGLLYGDGTDLFIQPESSVIIQTPYTKSISGCSGVTGGITTVQYHSYDNTGFFAAGTSTGSVCALSGATEEWSNLSAQAPSSRYTPGNVFGFGFFAPSNTSLVGYWNVANVGGSAIYQVIATSNSTASVITPTQFWNATLAGKQTSTSGKASVTFSNVPSAVNGMYADASGNVYVANNSNSSVYKLATGSTTWTSAHLDCLGAINLVSNEAAMGATASCSNAGGTAVYSVK